MTPAETTSPRRFWSTPWLVKRRCPAAEIVGFFDVTRSAVSQHLTVLKNAGFLTERKAATRSLYRACPEGLAGLRQFLDQMRGPSLQGARDLVEAD